MASLGLGIAGAALGNFFLPGIGGVIGGALGSAVGGLIDNMIAGPVPSQFQEGPRLGDRSIMTSTYGDPIPVVYGSHLRIAGNVIWSEGIIEDTHISWQSTGGGGGGKGGRGGGGVWSTTYSYRCTFAVALCEGPAYGIKRIFANKKVIWEGDVFEGGVGTCDAFDSVHFYPGNGTQPFDPFISALSPPNSNPAYRHTCYIIIENLHLADFGNILPQLEVEMIGHTSITVGAIAQDLCRRAEVENVSVEGLSDPVEGYFIARETNIVDALSPLALAFNFDIAEQKGQIRLIKRGGTLKGVVPIEDMGVVQAGSDPIAPIEHARETDYAKPKEVVVSYSDPAFDFQQVSQRASRSRGSSTANLSHAIPMVMSADYARKMAARLLYEAWAARRTARFHISDKWIALTPGDVIGLPVAGSVQPFKVLHATRGVDGVIELEARYEDVEIYSSSTPGATVTHPINAFTPVGNSVLMLIDAPILRDANNSAGFYWAVSAPSTSWRGAMIVRSVDGGASYQDMASAPIRAVFGTVAAALPDGPTDFIDEGNHIDVTLSFPRHTLEGVSEASMLAGANTCWIGPANGQGGEFVSYRDATLIALQTYRLTGLLRGRRGTEYATATHGPGETLVVLSTQFVGRVDFGPADWFASRSFKAVSVLQNEADVTPQTFVNTGEGLRPFSPVHVVGSRDGSNDLTISWVRRTRLLTAGLGSWPVPLGEEIEAYEVDVMSGPLVKRTISSSTPTATYSAANQATDGFTPGNPITVNVYQLSAVRGRGHGRNAVI